jgi:hypothetical protein
VFLEQVKWAVNNSTEFSTPPDRLLPSATYLSEAEKISENYGALKQGLKRTPRSNSRPWFS